MKNTLALRRHTASSQAAPRLPWPVWWGFVLAFCGLVLSLPGGSAPGGTETAKTIAFPASKAEIIVIPAGKALLGSDPAEKAFGYEIGGAAARRWKWFDREQRREADLPAYRIDLTLVTQAAYGEFVRATGRAVPYITRQEYREQGFLVHPYEEVLPYLWTGGRPPAGLEAHPVVLVSRPDGEAYCAWRGAPENRICRLPTEDEWEKAARGSGGAYFPWGSPWEPQRLNSAQAGPYGTTPVKRYPQGRSPYGLYDMAGNVFQWTSTSGRPGRFILKGCSWDDLGGICRAAARHSRPAESRHILIGFRCLCGALGTGRTEDQGK